MPVWRGTWFSPQRGHLATCRVWFALLTVVGPASYAACSAWVGRTRPLWTLWLRSCPWMSAEVNVLLNWRKRQVQHGGHIGTVFVEAKEIWGQDIGRGSPRDPENHRGPSASRLCVLAGPTLAAWLQAELCGRAQRLCPSGEYHLPHPHRLVGMNRRPW